MIEILFRLLVVTLSFFGASALFAAKAPDPPASSPAEILAALCDSEAKAIVKALRDAPSNGHARIPITREHEYIAVVKAQKKNDKVGSCK